MMGWLGKYASFFLALALVAGTARADRVTLRDGTVQEGVIVSKEPREIRLLLDQDRQRKVLRIPRDQVLEMKEMINPEKPEAEETPVVPAVAAAPEGPRDGFLTAMSKAVLGVTPDPASPKGLGPERWDLWQQALRAEADGRNDALMKALTQLAQASPGQARQLDLLAQRHLQTDFGDWLASLRWNAMKTQYRPGRFDLKDVTEIERPALIAILRQETDPALQPLQNYLPTPPEPGARSGQRPLDPLAGINVSNALEVKEKCLYASAVLLAQIRLEPEMPTVDRVFLSQRLSYIRQALAKAMEFEPWARMALERAERERKIAEERARIEAAKQRSSGTVR